VERQQFIYIIEPVRAEMPDAPTEDEMKLVGAHFEYLKDSLASGDLVLAGRSLEAPYMGISIFEAEDVEAAKKFAENDPAVEAGVFRVVRLQPYRVSLIRS
jgi:uncharacterized protein YciI